MDLPKFGLSHLISYLPPTSLGQMNSYGVVSHGVAVLRVVVRNVVVVVVVVLGLVLPHDPLVAEVRVPVSLGHGGVAMEVVVRDAQHLRLFMICLLLVTLILTRLERKS